MTHGTRGRAIGIAVSNVDDAIALELGIRIGVIVAVLVLVLVTSLVVFKTQKGKERNWVLAILLCLVCGFIPALVYVAVTVEQGRTTTYVVAPQPQVVRRTHARTAEEK